MGVPLPPSSIYRFENFPYQPALQNPPRSGPLTPGTWWFLQADAPGAFGLDAEAAARSARSARGALGAAGRPNAAEDADAAAQLLGVVTC